MVLNPVAIFHVREDAPVFVPEDREQRHTPDRVAAKEYSLEDWSENPAEWCDANEVYEVDIGDTIAYIPKKSVREMTLYRTISAEE
jgi:hypothetical protein